MAEAATINVRMSQDTKNAFTNFCDEMGISASTLMNMFAKAVVRNQRIPFELTARTVDVPVAASYRQIFPRTAAELDDMLTAAENEAEGNLL